MVAINTPPATTFAACVRRKSGTVLEVLEALLAGAIDRGHPRERRLRHCLGVVRRELLRRTIGESRALVLHTLNVHVAAEMGVDVRAARRHLEARRRWLDRTTSQLLSAEDENFTRQERAAETDA